MAADSPNAGDVELGNQLYQRAADDPVLNRAICRFAVVCILIDNARTEQSARSRAPAAKKAAKARVRATVRKVNAVIKERVLDWIVPGIGRPLRFITGNDLRALGEGFVRIAEAAGDQMVGVVLTEREAAELLDFKAR